MDLVNNIQINNLRSDNHYMVIDKIPEFSYKITHVSLPDVSLGDLDLNNPFTTIKIPGTSIEFSNLTVTFLVDEDLVNYKKLWYWMLTFKEFNILEEDTFSTQEEIYKKISGDLFSNAKLSLLTNNKNINVNITFYDLYPKSLNNLNFNTKSTEPVLCDVTFRYNRYDFE